MRKIGFSSHLCTRVKSPLSDCQRCLSACPAQAIQFDKGSLEINSRCTRCEFCLSACPNEVFSITTGKSDPSEDTPRVDRLYCSRLVSEKIDLSRPLPKEIIPCIGSLSLHSILKWVNQTETPLRVMTGICVQCDMEKGFLNFEKMKEAFLSSFSFFKNPFPPVLLQEGKAQDRKEAAKRYLIYQTRQEEPSRLKRRDFLFGLYRRFSPGERDEETDVRQRDLHGSTDKRIPFWLKEMTILFKKNRESFSEEDRIPFLSELEVDPACTGCGFCASLCPTGALEMRSKENKVHLTWMASHCSGCHLCEEACPARSIRFSSGLAAGRLCEERETAIKKSFQQFQCPACYQIFLSTEAEACCPHCRRQKELIEDYSRILYGEPEKGFLENG